MVDTHCHLVPGVDDGAETLDIALRMIEEAKQSGLTAILTTPHIRGRISDLALHEEHKRAFQPVLDAKPNMDLFLGGEVRVTPETHEVVTRKEFTASESGKYILLELEFEKVPNYFSQLLFDYRINGITPIVAHPERNVGVLKNPEYALDFVRQGALLQVTTGCLIGDLGEAFESLSLMLLECGLVSIIASDAHNVRTRRFNNWPTAYERLKELEAQPDGSGKLIRTDDITTTNPMAVCLGNPIPPIELDELTAADIRKRLSTGRAKPLVKRKRFFFM